jgi:hypothetical protein
LVSETTIPVQHGIIRLSNFIGPRQRLAPFRSQCQQDNSLNSEEVNPQSPRSKKPRAWATRRTGRPKSPRVIPACRPPNSPPCLASAPPGRRQKQASNSGS